jgi:hypothetical protein
MRLFALLFLFLCPPCPAEDVKPDTPAARQFYSWLDTFNEGNHDAYLAFLQKNNPNRVKMIDQDMNFRHNTGGFDLRKIEDASTPTKFVALIQ